MDIGSEFYKRYLDGDEEGMNGLIREYSDGLTFYLTTFVRDFDTAEDLMLDTFVKLGTKKPRDNGKGTFKTWLYAIGRNLALDYLRKHKNDPVPDENVEFTADLEDPLRTYLKSERNEVLYRSLRKINADYARGLWLQYFEGLKTEEIAKVIHRTVHATESMLTRARKSLGEELKKEGFTYEDL